MLRGICDQHDAISSGRTVVRHPAPRVLQQAGRHRWPVASTSKLAAISRIILDTAAAVDLLPVEQLRDFRMRLESCAEDAHSAPFPFEGLPPFSSRRMTV